MQNNLTHMYRLKNIPLEILENPPKASYGLPMNNDTDLSNLTETLIYLWVMDDEKFWFYITYSYQTYVEGYRWREGTWTFMLIPVSTIIAYY